MERLRRAALELNKVSQTKLIPGVEFTHVPPSQIGPLVAQARALGAALVVVHGETLMEPVAPGTNRAGLEAEIDILAHPGLISREDAELAAQRGIMLEISARAGHSLGNGRVAGLALATGAKLLVNSDTHTPGDLLNETHQRNVARAAGLSEEEVEQVVQTNARALLKRIEER